MELLVFACEVSVLSTVSLKKCPRSNGSASSGWAFQRTPTRLNTLTTIAGRVNELPELFVRLERLTACVCLIVPRNELVFVFDFVSINYSVIDCASNCGSNRTGKDYAHASKRERTIRQQSIPLWWVFRLCKIIKVVIRVQQHRTATFPLLGMIATSAPESQHIYGAKR